MRLSSLIAAATTATACVSVRPVASPEQFIPAKQPDVVWVTTAQEEVIPISRPAVRDAAIAGTWLGLGDSVTVPLQQARAVQARQPDRKRTTFLALGVGVVVGFIVWRAAADNSSTGATCYGGQYGNPACF